MSPNDPAGLDLIALLRRQPEASAVISGSDKYPDIEGTVKFYQTPFGVLTVTEVSGLPYYTAPCSGHIFAFHIHRGDSCTGNQTDPFANALTHYDPDSCPHPYHAGDMPPLFGSAGYAFSAFLTDRFSVGDIIGRTVIIHSGADDFSTQPSGNSGEKIACGLIEAAQ